MKCVFCGNNGIPQSSAISVHYGIGPLFVSVCLECIIQPLELAKGRNWTIGRDTWTARKRDWKRGIVEPHEMANVAAAIVQLKPDEKRRLLQRINAGSRRSEGGGS